MIPQAKEYPRTRRPETGWARARRLRRQQALRTWMPAVEGPGGPPAAPSGTEGNIVRGED
ncbi:hypothetical protein JS756_00680 [Streptomyces actuosus]|uniref:Integrase n=1 Tax=Streptomyces actuosus TaxID=1885 RepID=A0ABS2VHT0_STRAS|nr:hypothetical protein [Streptomyces actuosus]MBN0042649.1 hypothetical protein [Streptomyces actuosus]